MMGKYDVLRELAKLKNASSIDLEKVTGLHQSSVITSLKVLKNRGLCSRVWDGFHRMFYYNITQKGLVLVKYDEED